MSPATKASGLASRSPTIICSTVTSPGRRRLAIAHSVSLRRTGP